FGALDTLETLFLSWPLMFMGTIMLTEPFTMPPSRPLRVVYGAIVGALFSMQFHFGPVYSTPELALLLGNIYAFIVGSRQRLMLTLAEVIPLSPGVYEFVFRASEKPRFKAGQYLEWTLPHQKPDLRGNRRYLTISSSPDSGDIRFGTRMSDRPSTFKQALMKLKPGDTLTAAALGGDFTLPKEETRPLVFIAGGIGITPFASMLRHMLKEGESRDITLIYAANSENDFAYRELIENATAKAGLKPVYLAGARITEETITQHVADMASAMFYISGPDIMVRIYREMLARLGAHRSHIKSDYFPGL
ncbi:MAG TPA: FAD-dependent oxidoreductase, partial [Candidatus Paceibacterota bacterium]|nr:FAD-dependent oxidoreductase [Candidatus Paceibacterota bacterium]